jgi:hypothetical protein
MFWKFIKAIPGMLFLLFVMILLRACEEANTPRTTFNPTPTVAELVRNDVLASMRTDLTKEMPKRVFQKFAISDDGTTLYVNVGENWFRLERWQRREIAFLVRELFQKKLDEKYAGDTAPRALVVFTDGTGHVVARAASFGVDVYD